MSPSEYAAVPAAEAKQVWDQLAKLNLARNALIGETDVAINEALRTGAARMDARVKITE